MTLNNNKLWAINIMTHNHVNGKHFLELSIYCSSRDLFFVNFCRIL